MYEYCTENTTVEVLNSNEKTAARMLFGTQYQGGSSGVIKWVSDLGVHLCLYVCKYVCLYVCMYTCHYTVYYTRCVCVYMCMYVCIHKCAFTHICTSVVDDIYVRLLQCIHVYVCVHIYMCVCMSSSMHVCVSG